ncbi:MAG: carboxypeptidase-like regulatory domain-containing protein [Bryobacteraceae bacterium]
MQLRILLSLTFSASIVWAQTVVQSRLDGTITDPAGAVVQGATVSVADLSRGIKLTAMTSPEGYYLFPRLAPGKYRITASRQAFQNATLNEFVLTVNQAATADLQLRLEQSQQLVDVTANAVTVQAQTADTSTLINQNQIDLLPLNGRNFQRLVSLAAGVGGIGESPLNPSVNGTRPANNNFMVDGINANDERLPTGFGNSINASATDLGPDVPNVSPLKPCRNIA